MADHVCFIVPPHLLEAMAESQDAEARQLAANTLAHAEQVHKDRHDFFAAKVARGHHRHHAPGAPPPPSIVPDILLEHISKSEGVDDSVKESAAKSLALSQQIRGDRPAALAGEAPAAGSDAGENFYRGVYDMETQGDPEPDSTWDLLPGKPVRVEGQPPTQDKDVNQAYDSCLKVLEFYKKVFDYNSLDNNNLPIVSSVHFSKNFGNAFWLSEKQQMIYGDGDKFIHNFTACIDVIGHEMTVSSQYL
jgi:Zn-dependent metalloprotease